MHLTYLFSNIIYWFIYKLLVYYDILYIILINFKLFKGNNYNQTSFYIEYV